MDKMMAGNSALTSRESAFHRHDAAKDRLVSLTDRITGFARKIAGPFPSGEPLPTGDVPDNLLGKMDMATRQMHVDMDNIEAAMAHLEREFPTK